VTTMRDVSDERRARAIASFPETFFVFAKIAPGDSQTSGGPRCALQRRESCQAFFGLFYDEDRRMGKQSGNSR